MGQIHVTRQALQEAILKAIMEGRKVIKVNNGNSQMPPMDNQMIPPMDNTQQMPPMNGGGQMGDMNDTQPPMDDMMGGNNPDNGESEFDTNFDAGVEADEDTDPKKYIQQLTGKLSQSLSTYYNEQGGDAELCKYVGKMILKQAAKGLDEAGKKDLIKTINTTENDDSEDMDTDMSDDIESSDNSDETPIMESVFTKKELLKLQESISDKIMNSEKRPLVNNTKKKKTNSPFNGYNTTRK